MESLGMGIIDSAGAAVTLAIGLIGVMTLFLGLMKVGEAGGLLTILAKLIRPLMVRLFPDVPPDHPAMGAMVLNMSANALGLGNAATPFGIRAMEELDKLNERPGTATNAMALFLAINTSNVTILPTGVIALRAATGSADPGGILVTTLFATLCSTAVAIVASKTMQRFTPLGPLPTADSSPHEPEPVTTEEPSTSPDEEPEALPDEASAAYPGWVTGLALLALFSLIPLALLPWTRPYIEASVPWLIPLIVLGLLAFGFFRNVPVYETFVGGARDGFQVAVRIIPFLVGILVAIGMFRASGALDAFVGLIGPWTSAVGLPGEALPMALLRPLSGSGAYGVLVSIIADPAIGPDSYAGYLVSTFQGSTETTFYVLAVYFGAVGIKRIRHAMYAALTADLAGVIAAVVICTLLYG
ncbi:MAG: spore maturation protein [Deltaproteobacteria bacterium]|nr:MAG: spore maturation protein [Deltaproteobacteria bacterium]